MTGSGLSFSVGVFSCVADSGVTLRPLVRCLSEVRKGSTMTVRVFRLLFFALALTSGLRREASLGVLVFAAAGERGTWNVEGRRCSFEAVMVSRDGARPGDDC